MARVDLRPRAAADGDGPRRRGAAREPDAHPGAGGAESDARDADGWWLHAGIDASLQPWHPLVTALGTLAGIALFAAALPALLCLAIVATLLEASRHLIGLGSVRDPAGEVEDGECTATLVLPGTCLYIFWQVGMVHYLCEHFDTRGVRLAGVSSGAIGACTLLGLEAVAASVPPEEAAARVRERAQVYFSLVESRLAPVVWWPLGYLGRVGSLIGPLLKELLPKDAELGSRVSVGVRRVTGRLLRAPMPYAITGFRSCSELIAAVEGSSTVWLITRMSPALWLEKAGAYCADGVNPFSLFCVVEYLRDLCSGVSELSAPRHTWGGGLDVIVPIWNCGVMGALLPRRGNVRWVTPTMGGRLRIRNMLRLSGWWMAEQWRQGYEHARDLDKEGYWHPLPRRPPPVWKP